MASPNFALFSAGDAYSTAGKIMGRQSAGKAMIGGVARRWPNGEVHAFGPQMRAGEALSQQLRAEGHTGTVRWRQSPGDAALDQLGAVYYPAPVTADLAHARNTRGPASYSLFGVTHTLSSTTAMDCISAMVTAPFQPWDALICTSSAALAVVTRLQQDYRGWLAEHTGATRFVQVEMPVIPLGIDAPAFDHRDAERNEARQSLGLADDEVAYLFAGRLTFHAKANPAALYQALEAAATLSAKRLVCIEAGVFPNTRTQQAFQQARAVLAPSVRFITVDGADDVRYRLAWRSADVFVSLSDNIQETFGLTPLEAMAAGLPVLVSDWNGYKDTVRDGIDGYRIPVTLPPSGTGDIFALRHATEQDNYDTYIGRISMMTVVDIAALTDRIVALADDPDLRSRLGHSGRLRATREFDWPVILDRYAALVDRLGEIRKSAPIALAQPWPTRPDPVDLFGQYPTDTLKPNWKVVRTADESALRALLELTFCQYALDSTVLPSDVIVSLHRSAGTEEQTVQALLNTQGGPPAVAIRALMWLCKFGVLVLRR